MKVLVVEDDAKVREMLNKMLSLLGYENVTAANGKEALNILREDHISTVISDIRMPEMDGIQLIKEIKGHYPDMDVIGITGYGKDYLFSDVIKAGASDFILKPFSKGELEAKISRITRERELREKRDRVEIEMARAKDYTDSIVKSMIDALIVVNSDGRIERINQAALDLSGYFEAELIGKPVKVLFEEEVLFREDLFKRLAAEGKARDYDMDLRTKNGEGIPVSLSYSRMFNCESWLTPQSCPDYQRKRSHCEDKIASTIIIARDMRENRLLKELEKSYEQIRQTQAQLIQTSKLATLGEMSAGLAHEMNQPLGGISLTARNFRKLMERERLTEEELESGLTDIEGSVKRMSKIIQHIRTFARQDTLKFLEVNLNETVDAALNLLGEQLRLHEIEVVRDFNPELPRITGEPYQLEQVWINLISNAREAVDEKTKRIADGQFKASDYKKVITISTSYNHKDKVPSVEVKVSDNGIGMTEEQKEKIFEPFFTTKEVGKSMGLGLSISYGIIESHKGRIEAESKEGEGCGFSVLLPMEG